MKMKMNFLGQCFQKVRTLQTQTDVTDDIPTPHSRGGRDGCSQLVVYAENRTRYVRSQALKEKLEYPRY